MAKVNQERVAEQELGIVPNAADVFGPKVLKQFESLVDERESLREIEDTAHSDRGYTEKGKRFPGVDDKVRNMLADLKALVLPDGRKVQVVERAGNEYVDKTMLIEAGVSPKIIRDCTRRGAPSWHILVTKPREEK